jgi:hypothetical protein
MSLSKYNKEPTTKQHWECRVASWTLGNEVLESITSLGKSGLCYHRRQRSVEHQLLHRRQTGDMWAWLCAVTRSAVKAPSQRVVTEGQHQLLSQEEMGLEVQNWTTGRGCRHGRRWKWPRPMEEQQAGLRYLCCWADLEPPGPPHLAGPVSSGSY